MSFTDAERAYLTAQHLARVATTSSKGVPDVAPVTFRLTADGRIEIDGLDNPRTIKWRNVTATGVAALVVDDLASVDPWRPRGVKVRGTATADTDENRHVIRITPSTIWSWGINANAATHFAGIVERREVAPPAD